MADLRKNFGTSEELQNDGAWTNDLGDGLKLKLARLRNPEFRKMYQRALKPYQQQIRRGTLDPSIEEGIINKCVAKTVLLDWKKLNLDGEAIPYSTENALRILSDPDLTDFRDLVVELASDAELFREENLEDASKNLLTGSSGTQNGENTSPSSNE